MRRRDFLISAGAGAIAAASGAEPPVKMLNTRDDGYRGIWYNIGEKYSGGMATYPQQIRPLAAYAAAAKKTFFCYGGRPRDRNTLLHMVSYFDHAAGTVPRPVILLDKQTTDAHDNPCLTLDDDGRLWVFSNTHGAEKRSFIHRSAKPHSIDTFELVLHTSFSYGSACTVPGRGIMLVHNRYELGRAVCFMSCADGKTWGEPEILLRFKGHYQIAAVHGKRVAVAADYHPKGLDTRTNLYYLESDDFGKTWTNVKGERLKLPLDRPDNPALVRNYEADKRLVYLRDIQFDAAGRPVLLYLLSKGPEPGPKNGPREIMLARWTGDEWAFQAVTTTDHNYDYGQLWTEPDGTWRMFAPTDPGPQPGWTGGEVVLWTGGEQGKNWEKTRVVTPGCALNQSYVRRPLDAQPDFYAIWADGDPRKPSDSSLYFTDRDGAKVWRLPREMKENAAKPELVDYGAKR